MKHFLHWLVWDLRRFRLPLLLWVTLLAAFALFLWRVNAHPPLPAPGMLLSTGWIAGFLSVVEAYVLFTILSSDVAGGPQPHWKTRPPAGVAVAGSKLILVVVSFLALPLLGWWLVLKCSGLAKEFPREVRWLLSMSWMEFLLWTQATAIGLATLAAACARGGNHMMIRLFAILPLAIIPAAVSVWTAWRQSFDWSKLAHATTNGIVHAWGGLTPWIWVGMGVVVFLALRWARTPRPTIAFLTLTLPSIYLIIAPLLPQDQGLKRLRKVAPEMFPDLLPLKEMAPLKSAAAAPLTVKEALIPGDLQRVDQMGFETDLEKLLVMFTMHLQVQWQSDDFIAVAHWQRLKLVSPDGSALEAMESEPAHELPREPPFPEPLISNSLAATTGAFRWKDLNRFALKECTAEGVLRVYLLRRKRAALPMWVGEGHSTSDGYFQIESIAKRYAFNQPSLALATATPSDRRTPWCWVERAESQTLLKLHGSDRMRRDGMFVECGYFTTSLTAMASDRASYRLGAARMARDLAAGGADTHGWALGMAWYQPEGWFDLPLSLKAVMVPKFGDSMAPKPSEDALRALQEVQLSAEASDEELRRTLRYALFLASWTDHSELVKDFGGGSRAYRTVASPEAMDKLGQLLAAVPPGKLELLWKLIFEGKLNDPFLLGYTRSSGFRLLRKHVASQLGPADIAELKKDPALFSEMSSSLLELKLISPGELRSDRRDRDLDQGKSEEALRESWDHAAGDWQQALAEAIRRGLPWTMPAMKEVLELLPDAVETKELLELMTQLSDCPGFPAQRASWLRENAMQLKWDAGARRWVLPPKF